MYQRFVSNDLFFVQQILSYIYISCSSKPISGCFIWVLASPFRNGRFSLVVFLLYPLSSLSFRWAYLSVYCNETIQAFAQVPSIFEFINPYSIQIFKSWEYFRSEFYHHFIIKIRMWIKHIIDSPLNTASCYPSQKTWMLYMSLSPAPIKHQVIWAQNELKQASEFQETV